MQINLANIIQNPFSINAITIKDQILIQTNLFPILSPCNSIALNQHEAIPDGKEFGMWEVRGGSSV